MARFWRWLAGHERACVLLLGALAALRVLAYGLAFPFFTNVDEHRHVDMVLKYARGYLPTPGSDAYEPEMAGYLGGWGSPEYQRSREAPLRPELPPPAWVLAPAKREERIARAASQLASLHNHDAHQPPVYYAIAGAWLRSGRALGLEGGALLYSARGLAVLAALALVWISHALLRDLYSDDRFVRLGVPLLVAAIPQDCLYYVTGDALSPLLAGSGFLLLLRVSTREAAAAGWFAAAGLLTALALLDKFTNALLVPVALGASLLARRRSRPAHGGWRSPLLRWLLLWGALLVPVGAWLAYNQFHFGDPTATSLKVARLGWDRKPWLEWWDHPLFTPAGLWEFASGLVPSFWRGELVWYRELLAWPPADAVYTGSTLVLLACAVAGLRARSRPAGRRVAEAAALLAVLSATGILALLSLAFVFHATSNPPASHPYFTHGRLIAGALVPFAILYVRGAQVAAARLGGRRARIAGWSLLLGMCLLATLSELWLTIPVFGSPYNAFHLP